VLNVAAYTAAEYVDNTIQFDIIKITSNIRKAMGFKFLFKSAFL
jgi:hypothetical protein